EEPDSAAPQARRFSLVSSQLTPSVEPNETIMRAYEHGEPAYEQVAADVKAVLTNNPVSNREYVLAQNPAVVEAIPITLEDPAEPRMRLQPGQVAIEYIAH